MGFTQETAEEGLKSFSPFLRVLRELLCLEYLNSMIIGCFQPEAIPGLFSKPFLQEVETSFLLERVLPV